jgi:Aph-1 protein
LGRLNFFVAASLYAHAFSILHIILGVLVWPAYAKRRWAFIAVAFVLHLGVSEATLANRRVGGCQWGLGVVYGLVILVSLGTLYVANRRIAKESA